LISGDPTWKPHLGSWASPDRPLVVSTLRCTKLESCPTRLSTSTTYAACTGLGAGKAVTPRPAVPVGTGSAGWLWSRAASRSAQGSASRLHVHTIVLCTYIPSYRSKLAQPATSSGPRFSGTPVPPPFRSPSCPAKRFEASGPAALSDALDRNCGHCLLMPSPNRIKCLAHTFARRPRWW
jgi:hypothetical protein